MVLFSVSLSPFLLLSKSIITLKSLLNDESENPFTSLGKVDDFPPSEHLLKDAVVRYMQLG